MYVFPEVYGCLFIDLSWIELLSAFTYTVRSCDRITLQGEVEKCLSESSSGGILVSLSVRSAFDLFLQAMNFPAGSELVMSSINIEHMVLVAKHHNLEIKSVDIDLGTLKPDINQISNAISAKTVAVLVTQLYGRRYNIDDILEVTKKNNLLLIEDCAQTFSGPKCLQYVKSDVSFFSFGSIKNTSCLGGALSFVKSPEILHRMKRLQLKYPIHSQFAYLKKLIKYTILLIVINNPCVAWFFRKCFQFFGVDYKTYFKVKLNAFPENWMDAIRYQPSSALLFLMKRKLLYFDEFDYSTGNLKADYVTDRLAKDNLFVPGYYADRRAYWLYPILVDNPREVDNALEKIGVITFAGATSLALIEGKSETNENEEHCKENHCVEFNKTDEENASVSHVEDENLNHGTPVVDSVSRHEKSLIRSTGFDASKKEDCIKKGKNSVPNHEKCNGFHKLGGNQKDSAALSMEPLRLSVNMAPRSLFTEGSDVAENQLGNMKGHVSSDPQNILSPSRVTRIPDIRSARFLLDHVLYLPVQKRCPRWFLDLVVDKVSEVMKDRASIYEIAKSKGVYLKSQL